jgi:hypothetical protein
MSAVRVTAVILFIGVLGGTIALSKPTDLAILARVADAAAISVRDGIPPNVRRTTPLAVFHPGDVLTVTERVRIRLQTDRELVGAEIAIVAAESPGIVVLKGIARSGAQKRRAIELAEQTTGVTLVIDEIATPLP